MNNNNRGGEEVLLDVAGQEATEAFEDVGHSDEAREILEKLLVGDLKRMVCNAPKDAFLSLSLSLPLICLFYFILFFFFLIIYLSLDQTC